jgi:hypothetical protein
VNTVTAVLAGNNSNYDGAIMPPGVTLYLTSPNAFGASTTVVLNIGDTLDLNGQNITIAELDLDGGAIINSSTVTASITDLSTGVTTYYPPT